MLPIPGKKILFVDDDQQIIQLYGAVFTQFGFAFSVARNGLEAIEKAESEKPALILLDIMLPDLNGLDVLKKLKQNPETANIDVWMISNLAEQVNKETATSLGANDYLVKSSYTPKQVCAKIQAFFDSQGSQAPANTA
jgi:DNA-binding response OmpR family regulator